MIRKSFFASLTLLAVSMFFTCCGVKNEKSGFKKPAFPVKETSEFTVITDELIGINVVSDLFCGDNWICIYAYDAENQCYMHLFDKSGVKMFSALRKGRGPNEIMLPVITSYNSESATLDIFDATASKNITVHMDSLLASDGKSGISSINELDSYPEKLKIWPGHRLEGRAVKKEGHKRLTLLNDFGDTLSTYDSFPEIENKDILPRLYTFHSWFELSPDFTKLATASCGGEILETFSLSGKISNISTGYFIEPDVNIEGAFPYDDNERTILGFSDLFVDNSLIYTAHDGKTLAKSKDIDKRSLFSRIAIYDWNCNPVKEIQTDYRIERICVESDSDKMFAVVRDNDSSTYLAYIKLNITK